MRVKILEFVNERTAGGRVLSAAGGTEMVIDGGDRDMAALVRNLEVRGLAEIVAQSSGWDEEPVNPFVPEVLRDPPGDDLVALRVEAEAAGIRVDKRWGLDRLREEISKGGTE